MLWNARLPALAVAGAALLVADTLIAPASAQEECKSDVVTVSGRAKFRPFTKTRELEGRGSAFADAVANWRREVATRFGESWDRWTKAKDTTFTCAPTKSGKIIGSSFIGCTISGRPCFFPDADDEKRGSVAQNRDRDDSRDRDRDRDRYRDRDRDDDGARDKRRRAALIAREKHLWSRAYRREMARQDHLAAARRRAETRAYRREMARQDYLAARRDRAEARGWRRVEARQRYLHRLRYGYARAYY
jgi:hypothetical protein